MKNTREAQTELQIAEACQRLYQHPLVQSKGWLPNLFWRTASREDPFGSLRVDPLELEVLFAAICGEDSQARDLLEQEKPGRAGFIERSIAHGELPLLSFRADPS
ncbi:hypothetical protein ACJU26_12520 [Acidithiobacillus sp. M4-SHS-6]|uniref:hypothetical protein n=1 Tax=Acidithiobacillus sp. M4-SHS-6 TaxID=3383024 RepID=UPI0039BE045B